MDKAGDLLKNLPYFSSIDDPNAAEYAGMFNSWDKIAGPKLSQYSRIVDIEHQSLLIEADHPAIIQLLQLKYREILGKVRRLYPQLQISDLRMFVKNPAYTMQREERKHSSFPGDDSGIESQRNSDKTDIESIDNENFRELLLDMKKRSQV